MTGANAIESGRIYSKTDNFIESTVDEEAILMHLDEGSFSSLKTTGLRIWALVDEGRSVGEICSILCGEFDVKRPVCEEQTAAFLENLRERGLVEIKTPQ